MQDMKHRGTRKVPAWKQWLRAAAEMAVFTSLIVLTFSLMAALSY